MFYKFLRNNVLVYWPIYFNTFTARLKLGAPTLPKNIYML